MDKVKITYEENATCAHLTTPSLKKSGNPWKDISTSDFSLIWTPP